MVATDADGCGDCEPAPPEQGGVALLGYRGARAATRRSRQIVAGGAPRRRRGPLVAWRVAGILIVCARKNRGWVTALPGRSRSPASPPLPRISASGVYRDACCVQRGVQLLPLSEDRPSGRSDVGSVD